MITCHRPELLRALKLATKIAGDGKVMPIIANVVLRATGIGKLEIMATNLRVSLHATVPCTMGEELHVMHDAKKLHELVAATNIDDVGIATDGKAWTTITNGRVRAKIAGSTPTGFPMIPLPTGAGASVETAVLKDMINRTWFAASDDDSRPNFNGIFLTSDGTNTTTTATDGHRMCRLSRPMGLPSVQAIIPCIETLRSILGQTQTCQVSFTDHMFVTQDTTTIAIKLIDLTYPNVTPVYQMPRGICVEINREALAIAMKRSDVMATEVTPAKITAGDGKVKIGIVNYDLGEITDELDTSYQGEVFSVGLNPAYVAELLTQMSSDNVIMEVATPLEPVLFRQSGSDDYAGIIMPMRL